MTKKVMFTQQPATKEQPHWSAAKEFPNATSALKPTAR